jgi:hypothetical protein
MRLTEGVFQWYNHLALFNHFAALDQRVEIGSVAIGAASCAVQIIFKVGRNHWWDRHTVSHKDSSCKLEQCWWRMKGRMREFLHQWAIVELDVSQVLQLANFGRKDRNGVLRQIQVDKSLDQTDLWRDGLETVAVERKCGQLC